jgi:hypothetical protein
VPGGGLVQLLGCQIVFLAKLIDRTFLGGRQKLLDLHLDSFLGGAITKPPLFGLP